MKIAILTLPFNNNYGGYLQAYALMTILKRLGHDVELINRREKPLRNGFAFRILCKNILKLIRGKKVISLYPSREKWYKYRGSNMLTFVGKYITPMTRPLFSESALYKQIYAGKYDVIVVGSDQVWRPDYGQRHVQEFFLTGIKLVKTKLISYAASFGSDNPCYTLSEIEECGKAIAQFDSISLREYWGIDIIHKFGWNLKKEPSIVLDPTFLLSKSHYDSLLMGREITSRGKIFCYLLDTTPLNEEIIVKLSRQTGLEAYYIIDTDRWQRIDYIMPSIEDWLVGIRDAEFVVTDSYHGMVFSIIFNKPFFLIANLARGYNRFVTVLSSLYLEKRMIRNINDVDTLLNEEINWGQVNSILKNKVNDSIDFLIKNICTK